jgi:UDP-glucuronate 4-epimerase
MFKTQSTILVTGAAGFIGSHLVSSLLTAGAHVIGIDCFDPYYSIGQKRQNIAEALSHSNFRFLEQSFLSDDLYDELSSSEIESIVHLGAKAGVRPSLEDPLGYYHNNVEGTLRLLEFCHRQDIRKFIFASSSSVYGENQNRPWREDLGGLFPISPYAATKLAGEQLGHTFSHLYGIQFLALRFFTVFGPRQRPDLAIHKFIHLLENQRSIPLFGDGSSSRDYTFVSDIVNGILGALSYDKSSFEIINLGQGRPVTLLEMVQALGIAANCEPKVSFGEAQPGDVSHTLADISKAKTLLDYKPETDFVSGVEHFYDWYHTNGRSE